VCAFVQWLVHPFQYETWHLHLHLHKCMMQYQSNDWWIRNTSRAGTLKYCSCSLSDKILTLLLLYLQHFCFILPFLTRLFSTRRLERGNFWNHVLKSCDCRSPIKTASYFHPVIRLFMCTHIKKKLKEYWKYFHQIWYWGILVTWHDTSHFCLKLDNMTDTLHKDLHTFLIMPSV
jgi:hypothetical protein